MTAELLAGRAAVLALGIADVALVFFYMHHIERLARSRLYWLLGLTMLVFCGLVVPNLQANAARALEGRAESGALFMGVVFTQGIAMLVVIFGVIWLRRRRQR